MRAARKALRCPSRVGGRYLSAPKSAAGVRRLHLPPPVVVALRAHRQLWLAKRLRAGEAWSSSRQTNGAGWGDLALCNELGAPIDHRRDRADWLELLEQAGVTSCRLYDARHSAATSSTPRQMTCAGSSPTSSNAAPPRRLPSGTGRCCRCTRGLSGTGSAMTARWPRCGRRTSGEAGPCRCCRRSPEATARM